jgi:hypothetical protein
MAKRFCGNRFALVKAATRFSSSARIVIADTATAATNAASKPAASSGDAPTAATSRAPKGSSIVATVSGSTGSGAYYLDVSSVCFPEVALIVTMRHCAFANVADDFDIFVVMKTKSRLGSDLVVIENDEIPDRLVGGIAVRPHGEVMFCFEPACIDAADILE